jgi:hypothetical protein
MSEHWFWLSIVVMALAWYSTITIYVAIRGAFDIRHMLQTLKDSHGGKTASGED